MRMYSHEFVCGPRRLRGEPETLDSSTPEFLFDLAVRLVRIARRRLSAG